MPGKDRAHFETYTERTIVKHAILQKYLRAYLTVLKSHVSAVHYIDAFAGRGEYGRGSPGSPLIAISILTEQPVPAVVTLVENDRQNFVHLREAVTAFPATARLLRQPELIHGEFGPHAREVLNDPIYASGKRVATFAFIDPCGVDGVRMQDIARILGTPYGECLVLWNYSGIARWLGLVANSAEPPVSLEEFFGGSDSLALARQTFDSNLEPDEKERQLRDLFIRSLRRQSNARYFLPFRFEAPDAVRTSHYLIHCSGHHIAFKIMKEIMHGEARGSDDVGQFSFLMESAHSMQIQMFLRQRDSSRDAVVKELEKGPLPVSLFCEDWVYRPDDYLTSRQYKKILLELEREGVIEVVDPKSGEVKAAERRVRRPAVTLGDKWVVRLRRPV